MTTEIAILNRSAVALAADSAASVSTPSGIKVYDGVNKLFELIKGRPVGVMIYNAAELSFRPWETIIKAYRESRGNLSLPTLDDYVSDFRDFIQHDPQLFSARQQQESLTQSFLSDLIALRTNIMQELQQLVARRSNPPTRRAISTIVARHVRAYWNFARSGYLLDGWPEKLPTIRTFGAQFRGDLDGLITEVFQNLPLQDSLRANLRVGLIHRAFGKSDTDGQFSGVVIAGFGEDEFYPRLREFRTKAMYAD